MNEFKSSMGYRVKPVSKEKGVGAVLACHAHEY